MSGDFAWIFVWQVLHARRVWSSPNLTGTQVLLARQLSSASEMNDARSDTSSPSPASHLRRGGESSLTDDLHDATSQEGVLRASSQRAWAWPELFGPVWAWPEAFVSARAWPDLSSATVRAIAGMERI